MKRFDSLLLKVFLYGLPGALVFGGIAYMFRSGLLAQSSGHMGWLNGLAGLIILIWMALALYLCVRLVLSAPFRGEVLARLTLMRERDEREVSLSGEAARRTMLSSLAVLFFLLCLSCFQISVYRVPPEMAVDGKTGVISLGVNFGLWERASQTPVQDASMTEHIFSYSGLPFTATAMVLIMILWQIIAYNLAMRRLIR